jgi:hypothetical protein
MSRSYRRTPVLGHTKAKSEKGDKRLAQRVWRHKVRLSLRQGRWECLPALREVSNVWDFAKDGKQYVRYVPPQGGRAWWRLMGK